MDNNEHLTDDDLRKNLGIALIDWIRMINEKKPGRHNGSHNSARAGRSVSLQFNDLLSVKIKNTGLLRNRSTGYYR